MWRPDNWEEINPRITTGEGHFIGAYNNGVEAGADVMQKAIIQFLEQEILGHAQFLGYWLIPKNHWNILKEGY